MEAISTIAIIAIIAAFFIIKKKREENLNAKADKMAKETYTDIIKTQIKVYSILKDRYSDYYQTVMEKHDVSLEMLDALMEKVDELKAYFKGFTMKLCEVAEGNCVFINTQEEKDAFLNQYDSSEQTDIITKDVTNALLPLAGFMSVYSTLYWQYVLNFKVLTLNRELYEALKEDKDLLEHQEYFDRGQKVMWEEYDRVINSIWEGFIKKYPACDNERDHEIFMNVAANHQEAKECWEKAWYDNLKEIGEKYKNMMFDLFLFFKEMEETYCPFSKKQEKWLLDFALSEWNPAITLEDGKLNSDECQRIHDLYVTGKMKGRYSRTNEIEQEVLQ